MGRCKALTDLYIAYTVPVNKKFTSDDRRTIILRCERFRGTAFSHCPQFRSVFLPFHFCSIFIPFCLRDCVSEVSVNASFGSEDDLQMVAEGSRYESASFCVAAQAYSDPESWLINYARTQQRAKQRVMLGLGHN